MVGRREFRAVVDKQSYEQIMKLAFLEQHVMDPTEYCIQGFPFDEISYPIVLKTLEYWFGDEDVLVAFNLGAIESLPSVKGKETSVNSLMTFELILKY